MAKVMRRGDGLGMVPRMLELRRIGLYTRDDEQDYRLGSMERLFRRAGIELVTDAAAAEGQSFDLVIALGGDGTVLRALAAHPEAPVLAVNFGQVGFLTQSDREHLDKVLVRLLSDDYFIEERLTLQVQIGGQMHRCINEVVVKSSLHMVEVGVAINERKVQSPRGDGVIVGTPTGSTAYLMSTGAPLVVPDVDCLILKPLNEYSFSSRTIIVPGSARIRLTIESAHAGDVAAAVDGRMQVPLAVGDVIEISRSPQSARLVCFEADYFFRNLRERLRW